MEKTMRSIITVATWISVLTIIAATQTTAFAQSVYNVALVAAVEDNAVPSPDGPLSGAIFDFPRPPAGKVLRIETVTARQLPAPSAYCNIASALVFLETTPSGANTNLIVTVPLATEVLLSGKLIRATPGFYILGTAEIFRLRVRDTCPGAEILATISGVILDADDIGRPGAVPNPLSAYQVTVSQVFNSVPFGGGLTYLSFPPPPAGKLLKVEHVWIRHEDGIPHTRIDYCQVEVGTFGLRSVAQIGFPLSTAFLDGEAVRSTTPFYVASDAPSFRIGCGAGAVLGRLTATVIGTLYDAGPQ
jgi:hypothetical protein